MLASCLTDWSRSTCMALLPRWQYMTDESKALVKRGAVSLLVLLVSVVVLRALLPWVLLALIVWFVWSWARRP